MKHSRALTLSAAVVMWFIVAVTVGSELSKPGKAFLAGLTGHHWVTKSLLSLVLFGLLYGVLARTIEDSDEVTSGVWAVVGSAAAGGLIIFGFYIWHFLA